MCIGTFDEPIRTDRSNYWVTIKPSAVEATGYRIWTIKRSSTSKHSHWWNASCEYGKKLYVQWFFLLIFFDTLMWLMRQLKFRSSCSRFSIHFVLLDKYSANRSGKLLQRYSRLISLKIRTQKVTVTFISITHSFLFAYIFFHFLTFSRLFFFVVIIYGINVMISHLLSYLMHSLKWLIYLSIYYANAIIFNCKFLLFLFAQMVFFLSYKWKW